MCSNNEISQASAAFGKETILRNKEIHVDLSILVVDVSLLFDTTSHIDQVRVLGDKREKNEEERKKKSPKGAQVVFDTRVHTRSNHPEFSIRAGYTAKEHSR